MYCADRSVIVTLDEALAVARSAGTPEREGVVVDSYHVWWDPDLYQNLALCAGRIPGFHVSAWLVPTLDILNGRGLMGDGIIELRRLRRAVDATGYGGPIEVEIFNEALWALPAGLPDVRFGDYATVSAKAEDLEPAGRLVQLGYQPRQVRLSPAAALGALAFVGIVPALVGVVLAHFFHVWFGW